MECPVCKSGELSVFSNNGSMKTMTCDSCKKIVNVTFGKEGKITNVIVAGVGILSGIATILQFFGFNSMDELLEIFEN
jgi:hypothetical protein